MSKSIFHINEYDFLNYKNRTYDYNWVQYQSWFLKKNKLSLLSSFVSKPLSSKTINIGDPYVQNLLNSIHREQYPQIDFTCDDSGLSLTIKALNGSSTAGFDFDMYEPTERIVIEFLKRENKYVTNLTAHPVRYPWNYKKFISLWSATQKLKGILYLVNYSNDHNEAISIIQVNKMNIKTGFIEDDIGYKMKNYTELLEWLRILNNNVSAANEYLHSKPTEQRNIIFWNKYQKEQDLIFNKKISYNRVKGKIGKNYSYD